jgi:hypothetical protein
MDIKWNELLAFFKKVFHCFWVGEYFCWEDFVFILIVIYGMFVCGLVGHSFGFTAGYQQSQVDGYNRYIGYKAQP